MLKNTDLKSGDLLFFYIEDNLLGSALKFIGDYVGHVAIVLDVVIDDNDGRHKVRVVESNEKGLNTNIYDAVKEPRIAIKRDTVPYDEIKTRQIIWRIYSEKVQKGFNKYDYAGALDSAINRLLQFLTFGLWEPHRLLPKSQDDFCSEFIAECLEADGRKIDVMNNDVINPQAEFDYNRFEILKKFGEVF